jgi:lysophospholipase L1-like esterase
VSPPGRTTAAVLGAAALVAALAGCGGSGSDDNEFSPYVALGDSYTAAPRISAVQSSDGCQRSADNYPARVAAALGVAHFTDRSCGGAQTKDMTASQKPGVGPQLDALGPATRLVTVGIGGNDLNLSLMMLAGCPAARSRDPQGAPCRAEMQAGGTDRLLAAMPTIRQRVAAVLQEIRKRAPHARVLVVGYPQLLPPTGGCAAYPLALGDYAYVRELNQALDAAERAAAQDAGDTFVDVWAASAGHDVCSGDPWVNGAIPRPGAGAALHPDAAEQEAVAGEIVSTLTGHPAG